MTHIRSCFLKIRALAVRRPGDHCWFPGTVVLPQQEREQSPPFTHRFYHFPCAQVKGGCSKVEEVRVKGGSCDGETQHQSVPDALVGHP